MKQLTPKQQKILHYIEQFTARNGYSPTLDEIAEGLSVTKPTVQQYLQVLEDKGIIRRERYSHRSIQIVESPSEEEAELPLLGIVAAGRPIEAVEAVEMVNLGDILGLRSDRDSFVLRVEGNSMIEDGIFDGDYVVVERRPTAENGQTVVALLPDNTVTLKRLYREKDRIRLQPANPTMEPIYLTEVEIQGVVRGVLRPFK